MKDLVGNPVGFQGGVLKLVDDSVELVCLVLDRLHLLPGKENTNYWQEYVLDRICDTKPDSVHGCAVVFLSKERLSKNFVFWGRQS